MHKFLNKIKIFEQKPFVIKNFINMDEVKYSIIYDNTDVSTIEGITAPSIIFDDGNEKTLKKVGEKWSAFQTINFKNNSQPYYVLLSPNLEVLNKPIQYTDTETYQSWLSEGLDNFNKNYK